MKEYRQSIVQFLRFAFVGGINTLIDLGVLNILMVIFGNVTSGRYIVFKTISFLCAVVNSFFMNKYFTFKEKDKATAKETYRFAIVTVIGFLINVGIPSGLFTLLNGNVALKESLLANICALIGVIISMLFNFVGYKFFVFKK
jgi:putative flippase GtrA